MDSCLNPASSPLLIIRTCAHILDTGSFCRCAANKGSKFCRHHGDSRTRIRNMARVLRELRWLKLRIPQTDRDMEHNEVQLRSAFASGRIPPDAQRVMLYAMQLLAATHRSRMAAEAPSGRASNSYSHYHVPVRHMKARGYPEYTM